MQGAWKRIAVLAALAASAFAAAVAPASAAPGHSVLRTFSIGPGNLPRAIASDSEGNLYVYAAEAHRILRYTAAGAPLPFTASAPYIKGNAITGSPAGPFDANSGFPTGIAVDRSSGPNKGDIYLTNVNGSAPTAAFVFGPNGAFVANLVGQPGFDCAVAINQANGTVYIGNDSERKTQRYNVPAGDPGGATQTGELPPNSAYPCFLAVDSTGAAYANYGSTLKFANSAFTESKPTPVAEYPDAPSALAVDPADDSLYIDTGSQIVKRNSAGAQQGSAFGSLSGSLGVTATAGTVSALDEFGGVFVFGPAEVNLPKATTGSAGKVVQNSASVEGAVDPDGAGAVIECQFRYGPDSGYSEGSVPCTPAASKGAPYTSPTNVSASLKGLTAGTTYHYRVFATNANGTQVGADGTFTTPVAVEGVTALAATAITKDSAELHGSFTGDGQDTHYYFEYGTDTEYGLTAPAPPGNDAGSSKGEQQVAPVTITGLKGNTTYHYRLVAANSYGATRSADASFTTAEPVTDLSTEPPSGVTDTSAQLNGSYTADKYDTSYYFEWGSTIAYGNTIPLPPGNDLGSGSGRVDVPPATITGLQAGVTYHYRIVASNENGRSVGADFAFKTAEQPLIGNLASRSLSPSSAELSAEINPRYGQTTYRFEWGTTVNYGNVVPVPDGSAGSSSEPVPVSVQIDGLGSGLTYHFRVVATNQYGTTYSEDQSFGFYPPSCPNAQVRQETRSSALPDCRAYELVTPEYAQGAVIFPLNGPRTGYATNPGKLAYSAAFGTFPEETGDPPNSVSDLYASTRTSTGWYQKYIGRPATETVLMGNPPSNCIPTVFQGQLPSKSQLLTQTSPNMDRIINYDQGDPSGTRGQLGEPSNAPYVWDTSTGALLERWPTNLGSVPGGREFVGVPQASPDFTHFVFSSNIVFAPGGQPGGENVTTKLDCYDVAKPPAASVYDNDLRTGTVTLASVKEDGTPFPGLVLDVSEEGSRILMAETADTVVGQDRPLFLRADAERSYDIAPGHQVHYVGSSGDGATVYITSSEPLTADDHDSSVDLFAWRESSPGTLTRISFGNEGNSGNSDACNVSWVSGCGIRIIDFGSGEHAYYGFPGGDGGNGASENFIAAKTGDIYFESPERLDGAKGDPGQANLYVYRGGTVRFIASLDPEPFCTFGGFGEDFCAGGPIARIQVTPDGAHAAFVTDSKITSYDNAGHGEMYVYSPDSKRLTCVSCRLDGLPPKGEVLGSQNGLFLTDRGAAFFSTSDPLVPADTDEIEDVYEYTEGKAQLITNGLGSAPSGFQAFFGYQTHPGLVGVSANGNDVYFATYDVLVSQDHNGQTIKIYDARTAGGFPAERERPNCAAADECHGPTAEAPVLPPDRTSAGFGGARKHRKHHRRKHHHVRHRRKHHKVKAAHRRGRGTGANHG